MQTSLSTNQATKSLMAVCQISINVTNLFQVAWILSNFARQFSTRNKNVTLRTALSYVPSRKTPSSTNVAALVGIVADAFCCGDNTQA